MQRFIFLYLVLLVWVTGCATHPQLQDVKQAHQNNQAIIVQQAEQVQLQRERIAELETIQSDLVVEIDVLKDHVSELRSKLATPGRAGVKSAKATSPGPTVKASQTAEVDTSGKMILGRLEWVWFDLMDRNIPLRVDPGVRQSSLFVGETQPFERDGKNWIRFALAWESDDGAPVETLLEAPIVRTVKPRNADEERRPVVSLRVQIGSIVEDVDFSLIRKSSSRHPGVLGRNFVRDIAVIDVARQYVQPKHTNGR